jgi:hypothetical protein
MSGNAYGSSGILGGSHSGSPGDASEESNGAAHLDASRDVMILVLTHDLACTRS